MNPNREEMNQSPPTLTFRETKTKKKEEARGKRQENVRNLRKKKKKEEMARTPFPPHTL